MESLQYCKIKWIIGLILNKPFRGDINCVDANGREIFTGKYDNQSSFAYYCNSTKIGERTISNTINVSTLMVFDDSKMTTL